MSFDVVFGVGGYDSFLLRWICLWYKGMVETYRISSFGLQGICGWSNIVGSGNAEHEISVSLQTGLITVVTDATSVFDSYITGGGEI